jgi:hypothetical protein
MGILIIYRDSNRLKLYDRKWECKEKIPLPVGNQGESEASNTDWFEWIWDREI